VNFYPHDEDMQSGSVQEKLSVLLDAAHRYRSAILEPPATPPPSTSGAEPAAKKRMVPREIICAYNWQELAKLLREIRELSESTPSTKALKGSHLKRLAEIYEVLRGAKMPKLEAVRLALMNEASQLGVRGSQVA
jgi:hypothetical protein